MRKILFALLLVLSLGLFVTAQADSFTFDDVSAVCEVAGDKYTILTPDNIDTHGDWLTRQSLTADALLADWQERGVLLQAWSSSGDVCIEISAVQDDFAEQYYDVNQVSEDDRKTYRLGHSADKNGYYRSLGYDYSSATWKNYKNIGRFLQLEYSRTVNGETYRGYARKTVRNGYTIHIDYQVYGRSLKSADKTALENVINTWEFLEIFPRPAASVSRLIFSAEPPSETNTGKFTVEGSGAPGLHIIGVVMRMSASDAYQFEATIGKNGKFELDVQLPNEGVWMMTYTVENAGTVVEEGAFDVIRYEKSLLTVALNTELPATMYLTGSELVISGKTMKQTKVQCIVDGRYNKAITTNNTGNFSFTIDTSEEGSYVITLVFEKKNYSSRRFRCEATRTYTEEDRRQSIRDEAAKPNYAKLTKNISELMGSYMVYNLHIERIEQTSTGYLVFAGMSKTKAGVYKDKVVIRSSEEPDFTAGQQSKMYLKCIGTYEVTTDDGTVKYPYFDFQFLD